MKDYEQIISMLLAKIADLETLVIQQAARIAELERVIKTTPHDFITWKR